MSNPEDRQAIDGLFDRIEDVARNSAPRDRAAEQLIQQRLQDYPPAPYYMAQTILIQEEALRKAQERIEALERQEKVVAAPQASPWGRSEDEGWNRRRGPWDRQDDRGNGRGFGGGGGFLAGAAQTALGVTGGVLLGSAIAGMMTGGAQAEEFNADEPQDAGAEAPADDAADTAAEDLGGDDFGGGDFDMGGEF